MTLEIVGVGVSVAGNSVGVGEDNAGVIVAAGSELPIVIVAGMVSVVERVDVEYEQPASTIVARVVKRKRIALANNRVLYKLPIVTTCNFQVESGLPSGFSSGPGHHSPVKGPK